MAKKQSQRTPGWSYRYIDAAGLAKQDRADVERLEVHGDGQRGVPVRSATPADAPRATGESERSPIH